MCELGIIPFELEQRLVDAISSATTRGDISWTSGGENCYIFDHHDDCVQVMVSRTGGEVKLDIFQYDSHVETFDDIKLNKEVYDLYVAVRRQVTGANRIAEKIIASLSNG